MRWKRINRHVIEQRARIEAVTMPLAKQTNVPLVTAEEPVRWRRINAHVLQQRKRVEAATIPLAKAGGLPDGDVVRGAAYPLPTVLGF